MKRYIIPLIISLVGLYFVSGWAQQKTPMNLTDRELKEKIDSLVEVEQPLSAAPYITEAKHRAKQQKDTKWMLGIVEREIIINSRRMLREETVQTQISKNLEGSWTPLRQMLYLNLYLFDHEETQAKEALSDPEELRKYKVKDVIDGKGALAEMNLYDYIAMTVATSMESDHSQMTAEQMKVLKGRYKEFRESTVPLPTDFDIIRSIGDWAEKTGDELGEVVSQALRLLKIDDVPGFDIDSEQRQRMTEELIDNELSNASADGEIAAALVDFVKADNIVRRAMTEEDADKADKMLGDAVPLLRGIIAKLPDDPLKENAKAHLDHIEKVEVGIGTEAQVLPETYVPVFIKYRNVEKVTLRLYDIGNAKVGYNDDVATIVKNKKLIEKRIVALPHIKSRLSLASLYTELKGVKPGNYAIVAYVDGAEKPCAAATLVSTQIGVDQIVTATAIGGQSDLLITDRKTGEAKRTATIEGQSKVDSEGWLSYKPKTKNRNQRETIVDGEDRITIDLYMTGLYREYTEKALRRGFVVTDRAVYRPGQKLYFKGYLYKAYRDRMEAIEGQAVRVELKSSNWNKIGEAKCKTNAFGTVNGTIEIPEDAYKGNGTLRFVDEKGRDIANASVQIEDYKRTDNEITFDKFGDVILPGGTVNVGGTIKAASGLPVAEAKVSYTIGRNGYWKPQIYRLGATAEDVGEEEDTIEGETTTDAAGRFEFNFESDKSPITRHYSIEVSITDNRGETTTGETMCTVDANGSRVEMTTEKYVEEGKTPTLTLTSVNTNSEPYRSTVHVKVIGHKPMKALRPQSSYNKPDRTEGPVSTLFRDGDELKANGIEEGDVVWEDDVEVSGTEKYEIGDTKLSTGLYTVETTAKTAGGTETKSTGQFTIIADEGHSEHIPYLTVQSPSRAYASDKIRVKIGTGLSDARIVCVAIRQGKIVTRQVLHASQGVAVMNYTIPEDCVEGEEIAFVVMTRKDGAAYSEQRSLRIGTKREKMSLCLVTKRDYSTPGAKERWKLTTGKDTEVEVLASMYDKRLDKYMDGTWHPYFAKQYIDNYYIHNTIEAQRPWNVGNKDVLINHYNTMYDSHWLPGIRDVFRRWEHENPFESIGGYGRYMGANMMMCKSAAAGAMPRAAMAMDEEAEFDMASTEEAVEVESAAAAKDEASVETGGSETKESAKPRENFAETVFFYPELKTDKNGEIEVEFTLPDNLTAYRFQAIAHDKEMRYDKAEHILTVAKAVNVRVGMPRFLTEGDEARITADVSVTEEDVREAKTVIEVKDARSGRVIARQENTIDFGEKKAGRIEVSVVVPEGIEKIEVVGTATAGTHTDSEQHTIDVAKRNIEVAESRTFVIYDKGRNTIENPYMTGRTEGLTFSYTSNAFIEVLRALPTLDENPYPSTDIYLGKYETAAIAAYLMKKPEIRKAAEYMKSHKEELSTIENAESTPWLYVAQRMRKHDEGLTRLLDEKYANKSSRAALQKLAQMQLADGSFPWFKGMDGSAWQTASIVGTIGEMMRLGIADTGNENLETIVRKAIPYLDRELKKRLNEIKEREEEAKKSEKKAKVGKTYLDGLTLELLYARVLASPKQTEDIKTLIGMLKQAWQMWRMVDRVTACTILEHTGERETAKIIIKSIEENLVQKDKHSAYIVENAMMMQRSREMMAQSMMIITLQRMNPESKNLQKMVNHLILQKRGEAWPDRQNTARAVLALLATTSRLDAEDVVEVGGESIKCGIEKPTIEVKAAEGTGEAVVIKGGKEPSWGSWSRILLTPTDEMEQDSTKALSVSRKVEVMRSKKSWKPVEGEEVKVGDKIRVTMRFYNDEALSYVRLRDHRSATLEPDDKLSGYRGWWFWRWTETNIKTPPHYMMIGDATTEFFIDNLQEGWHEISYRLTVTHAGKFSSGYTDIECMYNPEFKAHTAGGRIEIDK
ncbi:MAG: hypothetical protein II951_05430 [Bacteroidales bacterium]|nr:hypothetical protein [Bacteroidales bacterium]